MGKDYEVLENTVLGGVLIWGEVDPSIERLLYTALDLSYFTRPKSRNIYKAIIKARDEGKELTPVAILEYLPEGYAKIVGELMAGKYSPNDVRDAVNQMKQIRLRARIMNTASKLLHKKDRPIEEMSELYDKIIADIIDAHNVYGERYYVSADYGKAYLRAVEKIEIARRERRQYKITGTKIDDKIIRLEPGHLNILAGRTSHGKTALAIQIVANYLARGAPVLFISLEMTLEQLAMRLMSHQLRIENRRLTGGYITDEEMERIKQYQAEVVEKPLIIYDNPKANAVDITNQVREFKRKYPDGELVIVDYIQLVNPIERRRVERRYEVIADIVKRLSQMAKQYEVSILGLAQLNRGASEVKEPPRLHHLRESGDIEQSADKVLFVWRPDKENMKKVIIGDMKIEDEELENKALLLLVKNRHGATGRCITEFDGDYMEFRDYEPVVSPIETEEDEELL